ncbi:MAG: DUF192 domain-containing protein [Epsilonproteobacteria bacterium]|nr:MAG: DUF192 domain-containing protein [Campylobacterota bacterium]RLA66104.1 MAG: DUF192 domain-containing protein [Campylobacterota bacterium]
MEFVVKNKNLNLGKDIKLADSTFSRVKGLMFDEKIEGDGLLIRPCNSIHTFFMKFNIDVLFLNKSLKVVKIIRNMPPWRMSKIYWSAWQVLEFSGGSLNDEIVEGDYIEEVCLN